MRRNVQLVLAAIILCGLGDRAVAGPASDAFGQCLVDQSTGHDRTVLVQWIFSAVTRHPALQGTAKVSDEQRQAASQATADMFWRLVSKDCRKEFLAAYRADSSEALKLGFGKLGEVAMTDMMGDPAVSKELQAMGDKVPADGFEALIKEAGEK